MKCVVVGIETKEVGVATVGHGWLLYRLVLIPAFSFFLSFTTTNCQCDSLFSPTPRQSTSAMPFTTLIALMLLWFGVSVPLTFLGACFVVGRVLLLLLLRVTHVSFFFFVATHHPPTHHHRHRFLLWFFQSHVRTAVQGPSNPPSNPGTSLVHAPRHFHGDRRPVAVRGHLH